jgi:hypothetical protein
MKRSDLKKIIKPIVKECIQESLLEDGVLSKVISEVAMGLSSSTIVEQKQFEQPKQESLSNRRESEALANLKEQRQKMLDAIGKDSMNGVNIFEGTEPLSSSGEIGPGGPKNALSGVDPRDPGVDISDLAGIFGDTWKVIKNG